MVTLATVDQTIVLLVRVVDMEHMTDYQNEKETNQS